MRSYSFLIVSSCFSGVNIWQAVSVNITLINHHLSLLNDRFELITISWPICVLISSSSAWLDKNLNICKFFYAILYLAITAVGNTKKRLRFIYPFFFCSFSLSVDLLFEKTKPTGIGKLKHVEPIFVTITWLHTSLNHSWAKMYNEI